MMNVNKQKRSLAILAIALLALGSQAFGASQINFRPLDETIDFSSFSDSTMISNPFSLSYSGGTAQFSMPSGNFQRVTQSSSWGGNFAPGDMLLWTNYGSGPLTIEFTGGLSAFATQIQSNYFGAGTVSIWAYDASDSLLGTFGVPSTSNANGDNSATLLGIAVDAGDNPISKIKLDIGGFPGVDFAINQISLGTDLVPAVPAPGALLLVGLGSGVVGWLRRRRTM